MITYWVNAGGRFGVDQYRAFRGRQLADRIEVRCYEDLTADLTVSAGSHIFSALDQLTPSGRTAVASLHDQLREGLPAGRILNDPRRALLRAAMLEALHAGGVNRFTVRRATGDLASLRFPVFVREDARHDGPLTDLLPDAGGLARALRGLRARGYRPADLLVVEFCDLTGPDGLIRCAAAYRVGEHILPAHLLRGRRWMLKWDDSDHGEEAVAEHREYILTNPHRDWVRRIFDLAGVDFGRLDYGIRGDLLQAWEINSNPTLGPPKPPEGPPPSGIQALQQEVWETFHQGLRAALASLDDGGDRITLRVAQALVAGVRSEARDVERRRGRLDLLRRIYRLPFIGRMFRAVLARLFPRS